MVLLADLTQDEMIAWVTARGLPAYRGRQLYAAVFRRLAQLRDASDDSTAAFFMAQGQSLQPGPLLASAPGDIVWSSEPSRPSS